MVIAIELSSSLSRAIGFYRFCALFDNRTENSIEKLHWELAIGGELIAMPIMADHVARSNDDYYAVAYGSAVPKKGRGVFKLVGDTWRVIKKGNFSRILIVSDYGQFLAIADTSNGNKIDIIQLNNR